MDRHPGMPEAMKNQVVRQPLEHVYPVRLAHHLRVGAAGQAQGVALETAQQALQTQAAVENSISLVEQIRDLELQILQASDTASVANAVNQVVELTSSLTDADGVDLAAPDQGGVRTVYTLAQLMASIEVFPVAGQPAAPAVEPAPELIDEHGAESVSEHAGN